MTSTPETPAEPCCTLERPHAPIESAPLAPGTHYVAALPALPATVEAALGAFDDAEAHFGPTVKAPADHRPKADDGMHTLHAEQLVDKVLERTGGGLGVVTFIGTMLGQLGEHVEGNGLMVDWESALIYAKRTEAAGLEAGTHNIVPKGTLILVLDVNVRPSR